MAHELLKRNVLVNKRKAMVQENSTKKRRIGLDDSPMLVQGRDRKIKFDVGGTRYTTSLTTICNGERTMLSAMFSGTWCVEPDEEGYFFIDRDGITFCYILNYLRDGASVVLPSNSEIQDRLLREAQYFQVEGLIKLLSQIKIKWDTANKHESIIVEGKKAYTTLDNADTMALVSGFVDTCKFRIGNRAAHSVEFGMVTKDFQDFDCDPEFHKQCWTYSHLGEVYIQGEIQEVGGKAVKGEFALSLDRQEKLLSFFVENELQCAVHVSTTELIPFVSCFTKATIEIL